MAQAGSSESSNRLRRFRGSKVGQGPLGGSESMSVRSRASLGLYLPRGVEVLLVIRDRMVSGESEGLQERTGQQGARVEEGRTKPVLILLGSRPLLGEARRP